jgi:threonine dehydratase
LRTGTAPTLADVEAARERIAGVAQVTPIHYSETFSRRAGCRVLLKAENLQRTGSFKVRGAVNTIRSLSPEEQAAGVVAATAGNHGQAVAWAARQAEVAATVFMPQDTPMAKVDATRNYGGRVEATAESLEDAFVLAGRFAEETGATLVHAFDDERVVAGQGTLALELAEQVPDAETVVVPVGGGGLAAGIALVLSELAPGARIFGVQAENCAPMAGREYAGYTIAEGIAVKRPGELTAPILRERLESIVTVSDEEISQAIVLLAERAKLVVEGAGAVGLAALLQGRVPARGTTVVVLSGGNIDPSLLMQVMRHGLTLGGRYLVVRTRIPDRPGELIKLLSLVAAERGNVVSVEHHREGMVITVAETEVELTIGTRDADHCDALVGAMEAQGYRVDRLS